MVVPPSRSDRRSLAPNCPPGQPGVPGWRFGHDRRVIRALRRESEPRFAGAPRARLRGAATVLAGPALIVGSVLVVLHSFAFGGRLTLQHVDILSQWLPTYCFLGKSLAAGHIPA